MICENCNSKNTKNAKFCSNCGHNLVEIEVKESTNSFASILINACNDIKGMFVKPIDTMKNFINDDNYMTALLYLGVNIMLMAIIMLLTINSVDSIFSGLFTYNYDCINSSFCNPVEIPYFQIFMIVIITGLITYALLAGVAYLTNNYLFKAKSSFKKMVTWLGINSVFNTISCIIITISFQLITELGIILLIIVSLIYTYNLFKSIEYTTDINSNKLGYLITTTFAITLFIICLVLPIVLY